MSDEVIKELQTRFSDLINYESEDPLEPINLLSYRTAEGDSCLHIAAVRGDSRAIELLLGLGFDVNQQGDMGNTALHYAKTFGHNDVVDLLIKHGAFPDIRNFFGKTSQET